MRGRWSELDLGAAKTGEDTEFKAKLACSYYKLSLNSQVLIEIDLVNMVEAIGGSDLLADIRRAIGI